MFSDWKQIGEVGLLRREVTRNHLNLRFPYHVQPLPDGSILVNHRGREQSLIIYEDEVRWRQPLRIGGQIVGMTHVRKIEADQFLGVDRIGRQVIRFHSDGALAWKFAGRRAGFNPIYAEALPTGEVMVLDAAGPSVLAIDKDGNRLWEWKPLSSEILHTPNSLHPISVDEFLIADYGLHRVIQVRARGEIVWSYGNGGKPGKNKDQLCFPYSARRLPDGNTLIVDGLNHRVIKANQNGDIVWQFGCMGNGFWSQNSLHCPMWAEHLPDGQTLIADFDNHIVLISDEANHVIWQSGVASVVERLFSCPRSIQALDHDHFLVADCLNNRILELKQAGQVVWHYGSGEQGEGHEQLYWPRSTVREANGMTWIADALNSRLISVDADHKICKEIRQFMWDGVQYSLDDPHAVVLLKNTHLLVVDSNANFVVELTTTGTPVWFFGKAPGDLSNPHHADRTETGDTLIADTGNNRVVCVSLSGVCKWICSSLYIQGASQSLNKPRFVSMPMSGLILVVDSENERIVIMNEKFEAVSVLKSEDDHLRSTLRETRWLEMLPGGVIWMSDYRNDRLLKFQSVPAGSLPKELGLYNQLVPRQSTMKTK